MIVADHHNVTSKYKLHKIKEVSRLPCRILGPKLTMCQIEDIVAEAVEINTPFNNPITGFCAFTHKAGIHAKAILNNPSTYEIIDPADFGMERYIHCGSRYIRFSSSPWLSY